MAAIDPCRLQTTPIHRKNESLSLAETEFSGYIACVNGLTKQEQTVLILVLGLLLVGWAVKYYRTAHPPTPIVQTAAP
jgi:hypothetical protein